MIFYKKLNAEIKYEWSYFKFCQEKGNLLILKKKLDQPHVFIIDRGEVSETEFIFINNQIAKQKILRK